MSDKAHGQSYQKLLQHLHCFSLCFSICTASASASASALLQPLLQLGFTCFSSSVSSVLGLKPVAITLSMTTNDGARLQRRDHCVAISQIRH
ncbi:hypothetical protein AALP_AA6G139300 [Arabis alpina]|uniref:Uncharacterized protein n=1 Tax=Arabis alpina TaxID=50452 RepID=A0A087GP38_ARAAL|nr:hypothetical protein AALP_AA6G139300 [Arabis alpina]